MNIRLRPLEETDAAQLAKHANNMHIASNLTNQFPHPYTLENAQHKGSKGLTPKEVDHLK